MDKEIMERLGLEGKRFLTEPEVKEFLSQQSIPVPRHVVVKDLEEALNRAEEIGYPLVLKVVSRDILHKTDVGGVITGLKNQAEIETAWMEIIWNVADKLHGGTIDGFLVEKMAPDGIEVIVGALRDEQFGPAVMFGIGGVAVELTKDVSFRLAPVTKDEAMEMMKELRGFPLLDGYRGKRYDIDALGEVIEKVSKIIEEVPVLRELEINPLIVYDGGFVAVDAKASIV